jgi:hypothetical protein
MKEPVDHILRPRLPWRLPNEGQITECGYDAAQVKTLTREEFFSRQKELGERRTAMLTCMTCSDTAQRWGRWENDPRTALQREIVWEHGGGYRARNDRGHRLLDELVVIAKLVETHRVEFDAELAALDQGRELAEKRRAWIEKKNAAARKPKDRPPGSLL